MRLVFTSPHFLQEQRESEVCFELALPRTNSDIMRHYKTTQAWGTADSYRHGTGNMHVVLMFQTMLQRFRAATLVGLLG